LTVLHVEPWFLWPALPPMTDEEREERREADAEAEIVRRDAENDARRVFAGRE
jgi:hypothetical protein